ncbi:Hint domain-containing protein [Defluviimonas sp. WL0075]|uniref:Hint domain-containing protein n=1 Tax=Albidovulum sediminicola TaxID=2984331 RepID=A0ABT2Z305_9RHOB|nr:Hint domain-containing protein [Defluviimonas sp. WL0075]MCV2865514.1 Hint domain-containing protein [Defluviimonas sp. WL0075]
MSYSYRSAAVSAGSTGHLPVPSKSSPAAAYQRPGLRPQRAPVRTRRYEIAWLSATGDIETATRVAPAIGQFEEAFSAFARGTVLLTEDGPVAVEDLAPGTRVQTAEGRMERVMWVGSMTIFPPHAVSGIEPALMTRVTADAFGLGRPNPDLVLGPRARILLRDERFQSATGMNSAYAPAAAFIDGVSIVEVTPIAPIPVYHLVLERHGSVRAAGLEVESYHPGNAAGEAMDSQLASLFLALFPHVKGFADFGPVAHRHLSTSEMERVLYG